MKKDKKIIRTRRKNYLSSIEGSILSNYFSVVISIKNKIWVEKISNMYFNCELILVQVTLISCLIIWFKIEKFE
jgi:hypothetical protein